MNIPGKREIRMSFDVFGNSKVDAIGFTGNACEAATKRYVQALNAVEKSDKKKPEYSQPASSATKASQAW